MTVNQNMSTNYHDLEVPIDEIIKRFDKLAAYNLSRPQISVKKLDNPINSAIIETDMINIYEFTDYRDFLKAYYEQQKELNPFFSYRYFARLAGIGGQSYLQMIMNGSRNLSAKTIQKFVKALKLKKRESQYFENLVLFNQTKKEDEKALYLERLLTAKPNKKISQLEQERYLYFTNKYLVIIREMISLPHFQDDPEWISQSLGKSITPTQVTKVINLLIKLNLLKRDEKGKLMLSEGTVKTPDDVESLEAYQYYRSIFNDAKEAILSVPFDKREVNSLTIPMTASLIPKIKEIIQNSMEEIVKLVNTEANEYEEVYQVNTIFYPVTESNKEEKNKKK